jgi:CRISPR/Cas system endoribonuclease Cas6 (RAMP superfamily)
MCSFTAEGNPEPSEVGYEAGFGDENFLGFRTVGSHK